MVPVGSTEVWQSGHLGWRWVMILLRFFIRDRMCDALALAVPYSIDTVVSNPKTKTLTATAETPQIEFLFGESR